MLRLNVVAPARRMQTVVLHFPYRLHKLPAARMLLLRWLLARASSTAWYCFR